MKKYKIFNKTGLAICLTLGLVVGPACSPTDDGPSIDDHFLNYEKRYSGRSPLLELG